MPGRAGLEVFLHRADAGHSARCASLRFDVIAADGGYGENDTNDRVRTGRTAAWLEPFALVVVPQPTKEGNQSYSAGVLN